MITNRKIAIIGLGYVGLPLAVAFSKYYGVIGFDIDAARLDYIKSQPELSHATLEWTQELTKLAEANFYIITVPTPVDEVHQPDLRCLFDASKMVGQYLKRGDIVVYESTVYPGATEEECVPILEAYSKLICGQDFSVGYSPERVNTADKNHQLCNVIKVISGWDSATTKEIETVYRSIITAGLYIAPSIKVAEAAKVIENTQRDLNIALMNELAIIFGKMKIDTQQVLKAASTKWNFLPFQPGLVGGHCISVDPYYLSHKAQKLGYTPEVILAGRKINEGMGSYIAQQVIKQLVAANILVRGAKVLILGLTFKENCSDLRNAKVKGLMNELESYGIQLWVHDPIALKEEVEALYSYPLTPWEAIEGMDAIVLCVAHQVYCEHSILEYLLKLSPTGARVIFDVKGVVHPMDPAEGAALENIRLCRL